MPSVFKPVSVKPIPPNAIIKTIEGVRVACWTNRRNRPVKAELTADGLKCRVESPTWWIEYRGSKGKPERAKGFKDKGATLKHGFELEEKAEDIRSGRVAPRVSTGAAHLSDYLPDFRLHLELKGSGKTHIDNVVKHVGNAIAGVPLDTPVGVNCERVQGWIADAVKRNGWSVETRNRYASHLRQFGRWLVRTERAALNPFEKLVTQNANPHRTRNRRRLSEEELARLIDAAKTSPITKRTIDGPNRARLYLLAAFTGLRMGALAQLTPEAFAWEDNLPVKVIVSARIAKNKKPHKVPLHPDAAIELADWLRDSQPGQPIFGKGWWSERGADMVTYDLSIARATWIAEGESEKERTRREGSDTLLRLNAAGEVFDFHAFRVQFISGLAIAGVPLAVAQQLADQSDPKLTSNIYSRFGASDMADQVAKLPGLVRLRSNRLQARPALVRPLVRATLPRAGKNSRIARVGQKQRSAK